MTTAPLTPALVFAWLTGMRDGLIVGFWANAYECVFAEYLRDVYQTNGRLYVRVTMETYQVGMRTWSTPLWAQLAMTAWDTADGGRRTPITTGEVRAVVERVSMGEVG